MTFLGLVGIVFIAFARPLLGLFTSDPGIVAEGVLCLRTVSYGWVAYALGMVVTQAFNGAGDTMTPTARTTAATTAPGRQ